ncbi:MAG: phosphocholine cytidylyltransferase family protein [Bacteriovorax sp.]|nr:phosphocholine cytidylyltransferase family protein [Bacteriovorax sp.]
MSQLTALILAAGYGSRISDVTTDPKSLLKINEKSLMDWHFEALKEVGIRNVIVVTGYKRDVLEAYLAKFKLDFDIHFAINDDYRVKGNTYSFYYGLEKTHGDFLLFDADLIYDTKILKEFVNDKNSNQILVGESSIDDIESAKAMIDKDGFVRMTIDKRAVSEEERTNFSFAGEAIGILKFSKAYRDDMYQACKSFLAEEKNISKNWEHVMNEFLLNHDMSMHLAVSDRWVEIDNKEDLEKAKRLFE